MAKRNERLDHVKGQRQIFDRGRKRILAAQDICGICGQPVDKRLKFPDPMSATIDHIIPLAKGGTNDQENLQLAHFWCNRQKSDRLANEARAASMEGVNKIISNRILPQTIDWADYSAK